MPRSQKLIQKNVIGLAVIAAFAVLLFAVPQAIGQEVSPMILVSAFILVSVYIVLYQR